MKIQNKVYFLIFLIYYIFNNYINSINLKKNYIILNINLKNLIYIIYILKNYLFFQYKQLLDLFAVDYPQKVNKRFELNYYLLSIKYNLRILIKSNVNNIEIIPTISNLYNSANWLERETWDYFGLFFSNHKDLRRILTDYGFEGYPLRKDFPLTGYTEIKYDDETKKIIIDPLEVTQEFRFFDFTTPWEIKIK